MCDYLTVEWTDGKVPGSFFGSDIFHHFRQILDEWAAADPGQLDYFGGSSLMTQSHGESLMSFFRSRYRIKGLYLLDEPETALSPKSQLGLLEVMREAGEGGHAQFVIATHSPIAPGSPRAVIYNFDRIPLAADRLPGYGTLSDLPGLLAEPKDDVFIIDSATSSAKPVSRHPCRGRSGLPG